ncbi:MAG: PA14 domain-containing protein [Sedimentisphaerales bacterium]|nr:PA14 domain-containing protein [Sedimentisphaerales bacterium]
MCKKLIYLVSLVLVLSLVSTNVALGGKVWENRVTSGNDDAEEDVNGGGIDLSSSDLEIFNDGGDQVIGLRFVDIPIPKGAIVDKAFIEITCDETKGGTQPVNIIITGELSPDTVTFSNASGDISNRPKTTANVAWAPENWTEVGQTARSSDITTIIQEIIDQGGWAFGNALVLILTDDPDNPSSGVRCAESASDPSGAPLLHIEFRGKFAVDPIPADGALYEDTTAILSWLPGLNSVSHDVYFGESFADVSEGTGDAFQGNQTDAFLTIGIPGFPVPNGLVPGTTYYWRIDEIEADGTTINKGDIWSFTVPSKKAYNHNISDGAAFIDTLTELSWTPGSGAKVHTVFFGDNYDEVNNAVEGLPQAASTYDPGTLESDKTYFWRIDEFDGVETHKGDTLSFTTIGEKGIGLRGDYYSGTNFDKLELTRIDPVIDFPWGGNAPDAALPASNISVRWTGDFSAQFTETYTFYTVTDDGIRLWVNGKLIIENWTNHGDTEDTGTIDLVAGQSYSIEMEYFQAGGGSIMQLGIKGPHTEKQLIPTALLWPPIKARDPNPSNGAVDVRQNPSLLWSAGEPSVSHQVYFGIDADVVKNADTSSPEYKGSKELGSESYEPGQLEWNTTYYWRVDEVNNTNPGSPWFGKVWSFTTADFLIVDDMESYNDLNPDEPASNRIYLAWADGYDNPAVNGSIVGYASAPFAEQTIVHGGTQSMPFEYNNSVGKSEATLTLTDVRDWTEKGVDTLTVWYRGNPGGFVENPDGTITMSAAGTDIWGTADEFRFAYKQLSGDGQITARVTDVGTGSNNWAKAGVMIRETLDPGSTHAMQIITPGDGSGIGFQWRPTTGAASDWTGSTEPVVSPPYWVRVKRTGNLLEGFHSPDGITWEKEGEIAISMAPNVYIGLCRTSHASGEVRSATFDNVSTTGSVSPLTWTHEAIGVTMAANDPDAMYVALNGGTKVYNDNPNAAVMTDWTQWNIDLQAFGVNLTNVNTITLGLDNSNNPAAGGSGLIYFDDIRLFPSAP